MAAVCMRRDKAALATSFGQNHSHQGGDMNFHPQYQQPYGEEASDHELLAHGGKTSAGDVQFRRRLNSRRRGFQRIYDQPFTDLAGGAELCHVGL